MSIQIPLVDLKAQYARIRPEIDAAIQRVLDQAQFILSQEVTDFEQAFARFIGVRGAVGVGSGTAALHLALLAAGVGPGDEVITTAHTFMATAAAVSLTGARPMFVDIDPQTYNLDPRRVEAALTPRTKALLPVHLYGQPAEMDAFMDIARRHGLLLIEDAAQAHGAEHHGRRCGSIGQLGCFSFYPGKNLGAYGDGGAITSNDPELLERVRRLHDHGRTSKYEHDEIGYGERLDSIQAAILHVKLRHLEAWTEARRSHARLYRELLAGTPVVLPWEAPDRRHVYHLFVIRTSQRDRLLEHLKARGIAGGIHYPIPCHRQPAYCKQGYAEVQLPNTEQAAREVLSLPLYPELSDEQVVQVIEAVKEAL